MSTKVSSKLTGLHHVIYIIIMFIGLVVGKKNPGDTCTLSGTTEQGICTEISSCTKVQNDIRNNNRFPVICGYNDLTQIVCCPSDIQSPTAPSLETTTATPRISELKCEEYAKYSYDYVKNYDKITNQTSTRAIQSCIQGSNVTAVKEFAVLKEFPHMVIIGYVMSTNITNWRCNGILISDEYVLTASYCASRDAHYVKLGDLFLNDDSDGAQPIDIRIVDKILHPRFYKTKGYDGIALLRLVEKVPLNSFIRPACLPTNFNLDTFGKPIVTGWNNDVLRRVTFDIKSHSECDGKPKSISENQFCAEPEIFNENTCKSNSDGILQIHHPSESCMYTVIGLPTSYQNCGNHIYSKVFSYIDWIEGIVWPNN